MTSDLPAPEIPPSDLDRARPLVDRVLADLRRHTGALPSDRESALKYEVSREPER